MLSEKKTSSTVYKIRMTFVTSDVSPQRETHTSNTVMAALMLLMYS